MPNGYLKTLPKYSGSDSRGGNEHITKFWDFTNNLLVEHEDVFIRLFVHSLKGDVRSWFMHLTTNSISSWGQLHDCFLCRWGKRKDPFQLLTKFNSPRKDDLEGATTFNNRFLKSYHGILENVRPLEVVAMSTYTVVESSNVSLYLRERHSSNLDTLLDDALELEGSMLAFELLASNHPHSPKESGCEQESKAASYTPNLVDSCLHEGCLTLLRFEEDEIWGYIKIAKSAVKGIL